VSETNSNSALHTGRSISTVLKALKFILVSYVISVVIILLAALIVVYTDVPESFMTLSVKIVTFLGAFLSALFTSRHAMTKGWMCGMLTSLAHVFLLHLIAKLTMGVDPGLTFSAGELAISALCGFAGGIIGVNSSGR